MPYPSLYQMNTRVRLTALSAALGRRATLDDIPDSELDRIKDLGFDWLWMLGVWQTGEASRAVSRSNPEWRAEYARVLPDLREEDIAGSCFAIQDYSVHADFGGNAALERLRGRLSARGLKLMLDFVPNHMALDHPWRKTHPSFFVRADEAKLHQEPHNYVAFDGKVFAYGRDPYFSGWPDTLQLNYSDPALQEAMVGEMLRVAELCDGVRCDMAMLLLPEVFERTWGLKSQDFWPMATRRVKTAHPGFTFLAEVYWDLEWRLQQEGFDYTYDKRLYDRLHEGHAEPVRGHLRAGLDFQDHLARFLENHDEPRAAVTFAGDRHRAAAVITFFTPGMRFFHMGQMEGWTVRIPTHLGRAPDQPPNPETERFYARLLAALRQPVFRKGQWRLLECRQAWDGNWTNDGFLCFLWHEPGQDVALVVVNYAANQGQCYVSLPLPELSGREWRLADQIGPAIYDRHGDELIGRGLYLDMPAWGHHVFRIQPA